ncbi:hypothetical protein N8607_00825 [bacterium]|jgi:anti-sigma factor RsiW|nr:hypothetical protein [bacterium]
MRRDGDGNDGRADEGQTIRTREEFESSLPLFVGGDLDPADERAVEGWLLQHPEDRELLEAAARARVVLKEHGQRVRAAEVPDLWPGVRRALGEVGVLPSEPVPPRQWNHVGWSRGFAAAAALALVTGLGFMMGDGGPTSGAPQQPTSLESVAGTQGAGQVEAFGADAEVELVGSRRRGAPLRRPGPNGEHLIDEAPLVPLWQVLPVVDPASGPAGSQLASDRR